jgi:hypothetical protein
MCWNYFNIFVAFVAFCSKQTNKVMRRYVFGIALVCALQAAPEAGDIPGTDVVVEMEPYVVRADRILPLPENWLHVTVPALVLERMRDRTATIAPGYYVLSNLNKKNTQLFAHELQLRQFAGTFLWSMLIDEQSKKPVIVILDRNHAPGDGWEKLTPGDWIGDLPKGASRGSAQGYLSPIFDTMPPPPDEAMGESSLSDMETQAMGRVAVQMAMRNDMSVAWVSAGMISTARLSVRLSEEILAGMVNTKQNELALGALARPPPAWLVVGLGHLLGSTEVSQSRISFAQKNISMRSWRLLPLLPVLQKKALADEGDESIEEKFLAGAFTHYGLYGDNGKHRPQFMQLVGRQYADGTISEEVFQEIFGMSTKKMLGKLGVYTRTVAMFKHHEFRGKIPPMPEAEVREATQAEAARLQAEALVALGRSDLALDKLRIAYWRGEREPEMLAALAWIEQQTGSEARARKILQSLMKLPQPPLRARVAAAKLRLRDALADKPAGAKLDMDEAVEILDMLAAALTQSIPDEDACETFASIVSSSPAQPPPNVADFLKKAAMQYAGNGAIAEAARLAGASP